MFPQSGKHATQTLHVLSFLPFRANQTPSGRISTGVKMVLRTHERRMNEPTPDDTLLARFAGGDRAALAALAERHERSLLGLARGLLDQRHDLALDAVQETWIRVIRFASGFQSKSSVKTWLTTILVNQCRAMRAKSKPTASATDDHAAEPLAESPDDRLRHALNQLGEAPREIVLLCYHQGLTHEIVAEVLDLPLGTVKSRLHAALRTLRAALSTEDAR
jgi:RNA polymerase sigma-70 factor (ECF subfamily)